MRTLGYCPGCAGKFKFDLSRDEIGLRQSICCECATPVPNALFPNTLAFCYNCRVFRVRLPAGSEFFARNKRALMVAGAASTALTSVVLVSGAEMLDEYASFSRRYVGNVVRSIALFFGLSGVYAVTLASYEEAFSIFATNAGFLCANLFFSVVGATRDRVITTITSV